MTGDLKVGFRWELTNEHFYELKNKVTELYGYEDTSVYRCPNNHVNTKGKFCSECGHKLIVTQNKIKKQKFHWFDIFEENGYETGGAEPVFAIYVEAVATPYEFVDIKDIEAIKDTIPDELFKIVNNITPAIPCAFVV